MKITKSDFESYEKIRASGVINMFVVKGVSDLTGIPRDKIIHIITNYGSLSEKHKKVE